MANGSDLGQPNWDSMNEQFYRQRGPAEYILFRLYGLCLAWGAHDSLFEILGEGVVIGRLNIALAEHENEGIDPEIDNEEFRDHFVRIESHHLKHLAIETLLRLFLGHKERFACPWVEISREVNFAKFKLRVRRQIVEVATELLQSDVAYTILGISPDIETLSEEDADISHNVACFLREFAAEWLEEAKSYNATKHGLTAVPGAAEFAISGDDGEFVKLGFGDSLAHLSFGHWQNDERVWSVTTRWIRTEQAVAVIWLAKEMIESLWNVARVRYGAAETAKRIVLRSDVFSIDDFRGIDSCGARELSWNVFREMRNRDEIPGSRPEAGSSSHS